MRIADQDSVSPVFTEDGNVWKQSQWIFLKALVLFVLQVVVGNPPSATMEDANMGTPFGVVMGGKEPAYGRPTLSESEVKLAFAMGEWTAQITRLLHDSDE